MQAGGAPELRAVMSNSDCRVRELFSDNLGCITFLYDLGDS